MDTQKQQIETPFVEQSCIFEANVIKEFKTRESAEKYWTWLRTQPKPNSGTLGWHINTMHLQSLHALTYTDGTTGAEWRDEQW